MLSESNWKQVQVSSLQYYPHFTRNTVKTVTKDRKKQICIKELYIKDIKHISPSVNSGMQRDGKEKGKKGG